LQEDKPRLFDSFDTVDACLEMAAPLVAGAKLNREAIAEKLDRGHLDATTLMEYLIKRGIPQRSAHGLVGQLVKAATARGIRLDELSDDDLRQAHPELNGEVRKVLGVRAAVGAFVSYGSTAPQQVEHQIDLWEQRLRK